MKRKFSLVMSAAMILSLIAPMTNALAEDIQTPETATPETVVTEDAASGGTTYYVDSTIGDDSNSGTSPETPWKSLDKVTATTFLPGDTILLKSGSVWNGEWLWPKGSGTADAPIKIDKYGGDALPVINGMGIDRGMNYSGAVHLRNQEYWEIRNLEVTNDDDFDVDIDLSRPQGDNSWSSQAETRNGILIIADGDLLNDDDDGIFDHIYIENCYVHDVDGPNDWNDTFTGGIIYNVVGTKIRPNTSFRDIRIAYNTIRKVDLLGITGFVQMAKSGYQDDVDTYNLWMEDIYIGHNYIEDVAQGGIDLCDARNAVVEYNVVDGFLKRYPNFRPTVALYPWKCENSVLQYNEVYNGPSTNADGSPYDMDSALKNVVYQFNYSHNNPCGWMLYMGRNTNDIIRYNISDDGGDFIIKYFLTANATPAYFVNNVIMYDGARTTFIAAGLGRCAGLPLQGLPVGIRVDVWFLQKTQVHAAVVQLPVQGAALVRAAAHAGNTVEHDGVPRLHGVQQFVQLFAALAGCAGVNFTDDVRCGVSGGNVAHLALYILAWCRNTAVPKHGHGSITSDVHLI